MEGNNHVPCTLATTAQSVAGCLHCRDIADPYSTWWPVPSRFFLQSCFLASWPQPVLLHRAIPVQVQDFAFADLNLMIFLSAYFTILWRSLLIAALPCSILATPPIQYHPLICWECSSCSIDLAMNILWQTISKALLIVKVYNIHCCPLTHRSGKKVGQLWCVKSILVVPNLSLALHVLGNGFQEHLFHKPPRDRSVPKQLVVSQIFLLALLQDGCDVCLFPVISIRCTDLTFWR